MGLPIDHELLGKLRKLVESQMGYREGEFDQTQLPTEFQRVADLARQFGIADDARGVTTLEDRLSMFEAPQPSDTTEPLSMSPLQAIVQQLSSTMTRKRQAWPRIPAPATKQNTRRSANAKAGCLSATRQLSCR